ncbi:MAG: patatin-like phospholipase family protein [Oscillospiraceae bacterium]|nr:patatin-like phospholipase family protein [Oscillospiraceae bacterium]
MKKALVFSGGGSRGAYHLGAWKAFNELSVEFDMAAGSSMGAVNAVYYVQGDYPMAERLWGEVDWNVMMAEMFSREDALESMMDPITAKLKSYVTTKKVDVTPYLNVLNESADESKFFASNKDCAIVTVKYPSMAAVEVRKEDIKEGYLAKWLLASSSLYPIFPKHEIDGQGYIDGGFYDKLPIATAFRMGADEVVAVDIHSEAAHSAYLKHPRVKYIKPREEFGNFLNFDRQTLDNMTLLGYYDTMKAYKKMLGTRYNFFTAVCDKIEIYVNDFMRLLSFFETRGGRPAGKGPSVLSKTDTNAPLSQFLTDYIYPRGANSFSFFIAAMELAMRLLDYDKIRVYDISATIERIRADTAEIIRENEENGGDIRQLPQLLKQLRSKRFINFIYDPEKRETEIAAIFLKCIIHDA